MRSPSSWGGGHYNFPSGGSGGYGHNLSPTNSDSYGGIVHNNNNSYSQQSLQLNLISGSGGHNNNNNNNNTTNNNNNNNTTNNNNNHNNNNNNNNNNEMSPIPGPYTDPRMFSSQLSHRTSPSNSTGGNSPPQSLGNTPYHPESSVINGGLQGGNHHTYQTSNMHGTQTNPAHSFLGTNSVTINNNYLMNVSPGGSLNLPLPKQYASPNGGSGGGGRTIEEDANNNQLSHLNIYRSPPTLYDVHSGSYGGYQTSNLKHGYEGHSIDQNGNVSGHHGEELDENSTPKVWRPY